jgi:alpha-mannosidase
MAKFEVCCHKFADLSEAHYGVSILNDSKYGFATPGSVMRLSLLRAPKAPDANADMGRHKIRWAIMPHKGPLGPETVRAAANFNNPMRVLRASNGSAATTVAEIKEYAGWTITGDEAQTLVIDTVKRGEDDADVSRGELPARKGRSVVLRIYESLGATGRGRVVVPRGVGGSVAKVEKCNVLEDEGEAVKYGKGEEDGGGFRVEIRPFEVATYRITLT